MIQILKASHKNDFLTIASLAKEILHEVYDPIIPSAHTTFFLEKYQTVNAIQQQITHTGFEYYLLRFKNKSIGYLGFYIKDNILFLNKVYLLKSSRGNGVGKTAMEFINQKAIALALDGIELLVNQQNENTIAFYKKNGFEISESVTNSFSDGFSVEDFIMKKKLNLCKTL
jgi:diamine N-acetyltransferase